MAFEDRVSYNIDLKWSTSFELQAFLTPSSRGCAAFKNSAFTRTLQISRPGLLGDSYSASCYGSHHLGETGWQVHGFIWGHGCDKESVGHCLRDQHTMMGLHGGAALLTLQPRCKRDETRRVWLCMPVIPALRRTIRSSSLAFC